MTVTKIIVSANQLSKREKAVKMKKIVSIIIFACVIVIFGYPEFGNKVFIFIGFMLVPPLFVWFFKKNPFFFEEKIKKTLMENAEKFFNSDKRKLTRIELWFAKRKKKRKDKKLKKWKKIYKQEQQNDNKNNNKI